MASLWDLCSSNYKYRNAKRKGWNTLSEIVDMNGEQFFIDVIKYYL